jgi:tetratricopeptide (TPR) repeat protein
MSRIFSISALAAISLAGTASAQDLAQFALQTTTDGVIALSARAFAEGDYDRAAELANQMASRPISPSRRSAAYANLCAAQSMLGNHDDAIAACEAAIGYRVSWEAQTNYGAALYNAGRPADAAAAFAYAGQIAPNEDVVQANLALTAQ